MQPNIIEVMFEKNIIEIFIRFAKKINMCTRAKHKENRIQKNLYSNVEKN